MHPNGRKIRVVIADDEPHARRSIQLLLSNDPDIEVAAVCGDGRGALKAIREERPDLVFLDVQMPELSGLEVLRQLDPESLPVIVLVTAYDQYAIAAFELNAVDYLLKPFDDERFERALRKARNHLWRSELAEASRRLLGLLDGYVAGARAAPQPRLYLQRIAVKATGHVGFVKVQEIDWIEACDQYVVLHAKGRAHLTREAISRLEEQLDPARFRRIHRSAVVNLERVKAIESQPYGDAQVVLDDGTSLKLSRSRREDFERALTRYAHGPPVT